MTNRHGDGTVFRTNNGVWKAQLTIGYRPDGSRIRKTRSARNKTDAQAKLSELRVAHARGQLTRAGNVTVRQHIEDWLNLHAPATCRPSTVSRYRYIIDRYVSASFKNRRIVDIKATDIARELARLTADGMSSRTTKQVRALLSRAFTIAVRLELVVSNPVTVVAAPKTSTTTESTRVREPLTVNEARNLIAELAGSELGRIVLIAIHTGMRRGEILGLKWTDIDRDKGTIAVKRSLQEVRSYRPDGSGKTSVEATDPKTRNSRRTLLLTDSVERTLSAQRSRQNEVRLRAGADWIDSGYVFTTNLGKPLNPNGVSRQFRQTLQKLNLRHIRFHDMRHSTAHLMLEAFAPLECVTQALGHSSITITKDIYAGYVPTLANRALTTIENHLTAVPQMRTAESF